MPYISELRVVDSRTISPRQFESAKAEREITVLFQPGELSIDDVPSIVGKLKELGLVTRNAIDATLGTPSPSKADERAPSFAPSKKG